MEPRRQTKGMATSTIRTRQRLSSVTNLVERYRFTTEWTKHLAIHHCIGFITRGKGGVLPLASGHTSSTDPYASPAVRRRTARSF